MEDNQSSSTADVASTQEAVDANDDVSLEDIEISVDELEDDSEDDEQASDESEETLEEASDSEDTTEESEETTEDGKSEEVEEDSTQTEEVNTDSVEEIRRQNQEAYERRVAERQAKRQADAIAQQQYLSEAQTEDDVEKRQLNVQAYNLQEERVQLNEDSLQVGIDKAMSLIPEMSDKRYQEEFAKALDDFEEAYTVRDKTGRPLEIKKDVFKHLQDKADSIRRIQGVGELKAKKDDLKARAKTIPTPSRTPKEPKVDKDMADFDSAWN